jgi:uncharacterized membrane protein
MTKGDNTCHWVVRKKEPREPVKRDFTKITSTEKHEDKDEALRVLRIRLAKGEITKQEYGELRELLSK